LLTGLARSGTTLTVSLLNKLPDTIALHEPMDFGEFAISRATAIPDMDRYLARTRGELLKDGATMTKVVHGRESSNPYGEARNEQQLRTSLVKRELCRFDKRLSHGFLLVVKHPMAFTALLDKLVPQYPVYALIRNPLSVLASWNSVDAPVARGRAPQAERRDEVLRRRLDAEADVQTRQIILLDYLFDRYQRLLAPHAVLRYETIVATEGRALDVVTIAARSLAEPLRPRNTSALYDRGRMEDWAQALLRRQGAWLAFYSQGQIEALLQQMLASRGR
jgi:hypothetical protein